MAYDSDGNYYYDGAPLNEVFDNIEVVEDADGNISLAVNGKECRVNELAFVWTAERGAPTTSELAQGEKMIYVADGTGANSTSGDLVVARNNAGTIEEAVISLTYNEA